MMRRQGNHPPRQTRLFALIAVLFFAAAFASFLLLSSSSSTTTSAQQTYTKFKAVSGHGNNICGIKEADGNPECWGLIDFDPLPNGGGRLPTDGGYVSVHSTFSNHCALKADGTAKCWGNSASDRLDYTEMAKIKFHDLRFSFDHACWLQRDDTNPANDQKIGCAPLLVNTQWDIKGDEVPAEIENYEFEFDSLVVAEDHSCALVKDSDRSTTGNQNQGTVECWGHQPDFPQIPASVTFKQISGMRKHLCGIVRDADTNATGNQNEDTVQCYGRNWDGVLDAPSGITFKSLTSGGAHSCGIVKDSDPSENGNQNEDTIKCWGNNSENQTAAPVGTYKGVSASINNENLASLTSYSCAITIDSDPETAGNQNNGAIACWGGLEVINRDRPSSSLDRPLYPTADRDSNFPLPTPSTATPTPTPPRDVIHSFSAGPYAMCMVMEAGDVYCTGRNVLGESKPPEGTRVQSVSVGFSHTCAISHYGQFGKRPEDISDDDYWIPADSNVVCWGDDSQGQSSPPAGIFKSVSVGRWASCGVKNDGSIACWGRASSKLMTGIPTDTDFVDLKVGSLYNLGDDHACALDTDGNVSCWGRSDEGQTTVPSGMTFKAIDAGLKTSCGIVLDSDTSDSDNDNENTVRCWGEGYENIQIVDEDTGPDPMFHSIEDFPTDVEFKEIATSYNTTCGILNEDYLDIPTDTDHYSVADGVVGVWPPPFTPKPRKEDTPYCQGKQNAWSWHRYQDLFNSPLAPSFPRYTSKRRDYYSASETGGKPYRGIAASHNYVCVIYFDGKVDCDGQYAYKANAYKAADPKPPVIAVPTEDPDTVPVDVTCNNVTYNGVSASQGGRFPTSGGTYYASVPPAALADGKIVGIRMTEGVDASTIADPAVGYQFRGKTYPVTVKNAVDPNKCQDPNPSLTISRPVDVCIPKPDDRGGRWWDWRVYKIVDDNGTLKASGNPISGFSDLGGSVCGEVYELPITVAAAAKPIPTPTPTPTLTPTPIRHSHLGHDETDLIVEGKLGTSALVNDIYVRIHGRALPLSGSKLRIRKVDPSRPLDTLSNLYRVGDLYVEINLLTFDDVDIGTNLNPPAEICIAAPAGINKEIYHLGDNATEWNKLPPLDSSLLTGIYAVYGTGDYACGISDTLSTFVTSALHATPTPTPTPIAYPKILRIAPNASTITLSAEERVRLSVDAYGVQDIMDNSLADDVTFEWSVEPSGGGFREAERDADADTDIDDREVLFTTPSHPGRYTVKAELDRFECGDDDGFDDGCFAEIEITVRRSAAPPSPTAIPANPAGEIPSVIVDDDGNQYEVFTPEEGGRFEGNGVSVVAAPGAVPNREIIGVRADTDGEASNVGQIQDRVTLAGSYYGIYAVDASGQGLNGYLLDDPVSVCLPVPSRFTSNISQLAMVSERADGTFATLSSNIRLSTSGVLICGALSELSARLAVGHLGSPDALPSPTPLPTPEEPDTGGTNPSTNAIILLLMLGAALGVMSMTLVTRR